MNRNELLGFTILFLGIFLLSFTFINAYLFLRGQVDISLASDLVEVFGETLTPLIETCIRVMYLGVMGWISSVITIRGVQLQTSSKYETESTFEKNLDSMKGKES